MAVQTKQDVPSVIEEHRNRIAGFGVRRLGLFGSFIHGEKNEESDVDVLVEFEPDRKTFDAFIQLSFFLEDLLQRRVELVTLESLSPYIGPHILDEADYVGFDDSLPTPHSDRDSVPYGVVNCGSYTERMVLE
jgi:predicted nucleotidyltransferase